MHKFSKYTYSKKINNKTILFNALSTGLLELDEEYTEKLEEILNDTKVHEDLMENLRKGRFLENEELSDIELMKYLHQLVKYKDDTLSLTIAPTLFCNFKCPYCYENGYRHNTMSDEMQDKLVEFIAQHMPDIKGLNIAWYGGEPLLVLEMIESLTIRIKELCDSNDVKYGASIITNGYLLEENVAIKLKELFIQSVQITLDGDEDTHDKRRMLVDGGKTYAKILENISNCAELIKIGVRINVDENNINEANSVLKQLYDLNLQEKVFVYVAPVDDVNNPDISAYCLATKEFSHLQVEFYKRAFEYGFKILKLPMPALGVCGAVLKNAYVIDPEGYIYKCWNTIGHKDESIGNISKINSTKSVGKNLLKWMNYNPFCNECEECDVLPLCVGGCPYQKIKLDRNNCSAHKYNLGEIIDLYYEEYKRNN